MLSASNEYRQNHLCHQLHQPTTGRAGATFARLPDGRKMSFGDFFDGVERLAAALMKLGLEPGDRVAVQVEKTIEALQLYVASVLAGGVYLPLNPAYTAAEIDYFLRDAEPRIVVCDPTKQKAICAAAGAANVLTLDGNGAGSLVTVAAERDEKFVPAARGPSDLAAILYTSGTTGRSKGAMMTHRNLASNAATLVESWQFTSADVLIHALPIFHTHGLFVASNVALMAGAQLIFMAHFDAGAIVAALPGATALMGVPTFYTRLLREPGLATASRNMRLFISGSAPLLADTHDNWRGRTGHAILERYGMTETNMNISNPYEGERRAGTVGLPLPGVDVKITDAETGAELAAGQPGMIEVRGPNVFAGYWRMPEKTAEELREDGFFITGDIAVIDGDGYVSIVGRAKDIVISGGYNVYPKEVEILIDGVAGVAETAVIGLPHDDFGEAVVALVVAKPGIDLDAGDIRSAIADRLARYKQPKEIIIIDQLPRNTMGKVQKNLLRQRYQDLFQA